MGFGLLESQSSNCDEECAKSLNATLSVAIAPGAFYGFEDFFAGASKGRLASQD